MNKDESRMLKISLNAQEKAEKAVKDFIEIRNGDKFSELMPPEWQRERVFMTSLVRYALEEYHKCLQEEMRRHGLELANFSESGE